MYIYVASISVGCSHLTVASDMVNRPAISTQSSVGVGLSRAFPAFLDLNWSCKRLLAGAACSKDNPCLRPNTFPRLAMLTPKPSTEALSDSIREFGEDHEFTKLVIDLKGQDPDDAFSTVPYEKGFTFLYHLEKQIGKEKWDKFIPTRTRIVSPDHLIICMLTLFPQYFTTFARKSLDSYEFKSTLLSFFSNDSEAYAFLKNLDWDKWFYAPGFPPKPDFDTSLADSCYALASRWENLNDNPGADFQPSSSDIAGWGSNQVVVFLEAVQEFKKPLGKKEVHIMGEQYGLLKSGNAELTSRFFAIGLKAKAEEVYGPTVELLGKVGRMKFVRPL